MSDRKKQAAAEAALEFIEPGEVLGVGTGSTVNFFIDALAAVKGKLDGAVASSEASAARLRGIGVPVLDLNAAGPLRLYVDGADEATRHRHLLKGGGGALTGEKIIAQCSETFVCILDDSKLVETLGAFPLPVEVLPMARSMAARALVERGGMPEWREGFVSDHGGVILDVHNLDIPSPPALEDDLNGIPGVVTVGLFARRGADRLLVGGAGGVAELA